MKDNRIIINIDCKTKFIKFGEYGTLTIRKKNLGIMQYQLTKHFIFFKICFAWLNINYKVSPLL